MNFRRVTAPPIGHTTDHIYVDLPMNDVGQKCMIANKYQSLLYHIIMGGDATNKLPLIPIMKEGISELQASHSEFLVLLNTHYH